MTERMHIWLVQESPGFAEAVVIAASSTQALRIADTDALMNVDTRTVVSRLGTVGPDDPQQALPILVLAGRSPYDPQDE